MQLRTLALALAAVSVGIVACDDDGDITGLNANTATVQFINATALSLDIAQSGTVATGNGALSYGTTSACITADASNSNLAVRQTGTSTALAGFAPSFLAGGNYSVIVYPGAGAATQFATVSNAFTPTAGQGGLRVFNAAGAGTSYDIYIGPAGVLAGSARLAQEAREEDEERQQLYALEERRRQSKRKRTVLEAQLAALQADIAAEEAELQQFTRQEERRRARRQQERASMAQRRHSDAREASESSGNATHTGEL